MKIEGPSLLALLLFSSCLYAEAQDKPSDEAIEDENLVKVNTPSGIIIGIRKGREENNNEEKEQYQFLGIPYAEPPVGKLRFLDPRAKTPSNAEPFNATQFGSECPQIEDKGPDEGKVKGDEDCLTLNVYAPRVPSRMDRLPTVSSLLPVMVYIHGGGFIKFSSKYFDPTPLLKKGVIVVTMNYRLGALGFLSMSNSHVGGNMGLKDQLEAFKWVSKNIRSFGGNPDKVTIFGQSSGAISAHLHQLSPQGQGLYSGVITQSGNALSLNSFMSKKTTERHSVRFIEEFGCQSNDVYEDPTVILQCLQKMDLEEMLKSTQTTNNIPDRVDKAKNGSEAYHFAPTVDAYSSYSMLPDQPINLINQGAQKQLPMITGLVENEGALYLAWMWNQLDDLSANWPYIGSSLISAASYNTATDEELLLADATKHFYVGRNNFSQDQSQEFMDMISDVSWVSSMLKSVKLQSEVQTQPIFMYELTHKPSRSVIELAGSETGAAAEDFGVGHVDDLFFFFDNLFDLKSAIQTEEDKATQEALTTMWTNFAKHGDPTPFRENKLPTWEAFNNDEKGYLQISAESKMKSNLHPGRMYFWDKMYWDDAEITASTHALDPSPSFTSATGLGHLPIPVPRQSSVALPSHSHPPAASNNRVVPSPYVGLHFAYTHPSPTTIH